MILIHCMVLYVTCIWSICYLLTQTENVIYYNYNLIVMCMVNFCCSVSSIFSCFTFSLNARYSGWTSILFSC